MSNWLPVAAYMAGLFALSSVSQPPTFAAEPSDKVIHILLYAGLAAVSLRALADRHWRQITGRRAVDAVLIAIAYGAFDEFHQSFVIGRASEIADWIADASGAMVAAVALWLCAILLRQGIPKTEYRNPNSDDDQRRGD